MRTSSQRGFETLELIVVVALIGMLAALGVPSLVRHTAGQRVRLAAGELTSVLRLARSHAVRGGHKVAVKFTTGSDGAVSFRLYRDGDGVRSADIAAGVDPPMSGVRRLQHFGPRVVFGFPPGPPPRDPGDPRRRLRRLDDPIRFNRSDLASFSPVGSATPGSLYLTDRREELVVVRVLGATGRPRMLVWNRDEDRWERQ